jgi:hypothetical protein
LSEYNKHILIQVTLCEERGKREKVVGGEERLAKNY